MWVDGIMDSLRHLISSYITWVDKDHIDKEATMKQLQESTWYSNIRYHVETRQKYIERAVDGLRKEHGEQIATLKSMVADLLEENMDNRENHKEPVTVVQTELAELKSRLATMELKASLDKLPSPTRKVSYRSFLLGGFLLLLAYILYIHYTYTPSVYYKYTPYLFKIDNTNMLYLE